jgi:Tol biopolymer transport system component
VRATLVAIVLAPCVGVGVAAEPAAAATDVIAVATNADGGRDTEIALVTSDGTVVRFLTQNALDDRDPCWSPDRRRIAFARVGARRGGIHVIGVAGRSVRRLTRGRDQAPAFSPDWKRVAFVRGRTGPALPFSSDMRSRSSTSPAGARRCSLRAAATTTPPSGRS